MSVIMLIVPEQSILTKYKQLWVTPLFNQFTLENVHVLGLQTIYRPIKRSTLPACPMTVKPPVIQIS